MPKLSEFLKPFLENDNKKVFVKDLYDHMYKIYKNDPEFLKSMATNETDNVELINLNNTTENKEQPFGE
jgi:hypothetical protein